VSNREIKPGEEVTISYVNPSWPAELRQDYLEREYGFECHCQRCFYERKIMEEMRVAEANGENGTTEMTTS
jgi:hypothetical protein